MIGTSDEYAVTGGVIFTGSEVLHDHALLVAGERVSGIVPHGEVPRGMACVEADGRLIMPGLVNAHHHAYSALATGMPGKPAGDFRSVLEQVWWRLDERLDAEAVLLSARWTALQCLQHGVTTVIDHHASYGVVRGALEVLRREFEGSGLSSAVSFEVSGRHGRELALAALEENLGFERSARTARLIGLHAGFTLDDEVLAAVQARVARGDGVHIHCAEDEIDTASAEGRLIERLERFGIVRENSLLVHGVHLSEGELTRVAGAGAAIVHCPESNMHNGVGAFDLVRAAGLGVRVVCGTDGLHSNMLRSYAAAYVLSRHTRRRADVGYAETRQMYEATQALAGGMFADSNGRLEAGRRADIAVLAYRPHTPVTAENVWGHVLYGAAPGPVHMTISGGQVRYIDGTWPGCDARRISAACAAAAVRLWEGMEVEA